VKDPLTEEGDMAFIEREVGMAVAATAVTLSPKARDFVRKGAVYGVAGVLKAGDVVYSTARGAARGAQASITGQSEGSGNGRAETAPARTSRAAASRARTEVASTARGASA
jgi:hypothetical protein